MEEWSGQVEWSGGVERPGGVEWRSGAARWRMGLPLHTTLRLAFWATLVCLQVAVMMSVLSQGESILGVLLSGVYVLFYFCAASVSCPPVSTEADPLSSLQQVFFLFYTTYVAGWRLKLAGET